MSMTFLQIQNALLPVGIGNTARFKDTQRDEVKNWINDRYAEVWGLEDWTFKKGYANPTVTAGNYILAAPADFGLGIALIRDDGYPLEFMEHDAFFSYYRELAYSSATGTPDSYTVVNRQILLAPTPAASNASYQIFYEKKLTALVADGDIPLLPPERHYMLVHGAEATGQVRMQDFTYQFSEQRWQNEIDALRRDYLVDVRVSGRQWGAAEWNC